MKVEYVGASQTLAFIHRAVGKGSNAKELSKEIEKETGIITRIRDSNLIVGTTVVPVGMVVLVKDGIVSTLSHDAFEKQYREVVDIDVDTFKKLESRLDKLEKALDNKDA